MTSPDASERPPTSPRPAPPSTSFSALGTLSTRLFLYPLALIGMVILARALGAHDRGQYSVLLLFSSFLLPLCMVGFGQGIRYFLSSETYAARDVAVSAIVIGALLGALSSCLGWVLWRVDLLGGVARGVPAHLIVVVLSLLPIQGAQLASGRVLIGQSSFAYSNVTAIAPAVLQPVLIIALVGVAGLGLDGALLAYSVNTLVVFGLQIAVVIKTARPTLTLHVPFILSSLRFGAKVWIGSLATRANLRLDQVLLAAFVPAEELGRYSIAVRIAEFLWLAIGGIAPPFVNRMARMKSTAERSVMMARVHRLLVWGVSGIGLIFAAISYIAVPLVFGPEYDGAEIYVAVLIPGAIAMTSAKITKKFFFADHRPGFSSVVGVVGGVTGIAAYLLLVPLYGGLGAALGSTLSYAVTSVAGVALYRYAVPALERGSLFVLRRDDIRWLANRLSGAFKRLAKATSR